MLLLFALAALAGAASAAPVPAIASEVKLEVNENCVEPIWPCWATPGSSQPALRITIASGDSVAFADEKTAANVAWIGSVPLCESAVPVAPTAPKTGWEGKCTFEKAGIYHFESSTLFNDGVIDYTKYEVVVGGSPKAKTTPTVTQHQAEATLTGSIEPEGTPTEYHFDYGSTSVAEHSSPPISLGVVDFTNHSVSLPVSGLLPGTEYHFELIVSYGAGQTVPGGVQTFTTPPAGEPTVSTLAASSLKETEATLNGKVDPEGGAEADYSFEWGTGSSGSYEHTTQVGSLPSDGAEHQVSATLTGLTPGSEYHFRLVASNKLGSVQGNDVTFTSTAPAKEPAPTPTPSGGNPTATASSPPAPAPSPAQPKLEHASGPLFGSVRLAAPPHGGVVQGSLVVSSIGSKGRLQIELLTKGATAPIGKLVRSSLHAGKLTFALRLGAKGKAALRRHRRLTLTLKITLAPQHGAAVTVTRGIVLRA